MASATILVVASDPDPGSRRRPLQPGRCTCGEPPPAISTPCVPSRNTGKKHKHKAQRARNTHGPTTTANGPRPIRGNILSIIIIMWQFYPCHLAAGKFEGPSPLQVLESSFKCPGSKVLPLFFLVSFTFSSSLLFLQFKVQVQAAVGT